MSRPPSAQGVELSPANSAARHIGEVRRKSTIARDAARSLPLRGPRRSSTVLDGLFAAMRAGSGLGRRREWAGRRGGRQNPGRHWTRPRAVYEVAINCSPLRLGSEQSAEVLNVSSGGDAVSDETGRPAVRYAVLGQEPRMYRSDGSPIRVLLVDDERALTGLVGRALQFEGWIIETAHDADDAVAKYKEHEPDVLVLDVMMPGGDGFSVLQQIRTPGESARYIPVLFLTALDSVRDRVAGLTAGGDDYLTKPFSLEELVARLRGLLRRSAYLTPDSAEILTVGDLELHAASREVFRAGSAVALTTTEFDLLRYMMRHPLRAIPRDELLRRVWGYEFATRSSVVELYVSYLRKKIDAGRAPMLQTVRGVGYLIRPAQ